MKSPRRIAPMSNTERQRRFRDRNPGYYGRLHRKRKAEIKARLAAQYALAAAKTPLQLPAATPQLEQLTLFDELQRQREREVVPIERSAAESQL